MSPDLLPADLYTPIALTLVAVIYALDRWGYLPKRRTSAEAEGELAIKDRTIARVTGERDILRSERDRLAQERSLTPILEAIQAVLESQQQTIAKLAHFNGALARQEEGLREATEALRMVAGLVVGVSDIPVRKPE